MRRQRCRTVVGVLLLVLLAGCGQSERLPITGKVTLDNAPLAGAAVTLLPRGDTKGTGGTGRTNAEGVFTLVNRQGKPGIEPGEYTVVISKLVLPDGSDFPADSPKPPIESNARERLAPEYSDAVRSKIPPATITPETKTLEFSLSSQPQ